MKRFLVFICLLIASGLPVKSFAYESCEDVIIGMTQAGPGVGSNPIYQKNCQWLAGAVAINLETRVFTSAWNYPSSEDAGKYVTSQCGNKCVAVWFYENWAYIAISADDRHYGISVKNSNDAVAECQSAGGSDCDAVIGASSGNPAVYWLYGAIAYDVATGNTGSGWNYRRRFEAENAGKASCGTEKCWVYTFQTGYGAIAKSTDGQLFGDWSSSSEKQAIKSAEKRCKKIANDKNCKSVISGSAENSSALKTIELKLPSPPVPSAQ
jgi:hypothetical protein